MEPKYAAASEAEELSRKLLDVSIPITVDKAVRRSLYFKVGGYNVRLHDLALYYYRAKRDSILPRSFPLRDYLSPWGYFYLRSKGSLISPLWKRINAAIYKAHRFSGSKYIVNEIPLFDLIPVQPRLNISPKPVLFFGSMNNYFNPLLPVMDTLEGRCLAVIPRRSSPEGSKEWGNFERITRHPVCYFEDFFDGDVKKIMDDARSTLTQWYKINSLGLRELCRFEQTGLWSFVNKGLKILYTNLLPHSIAYYEMAKRILVSLQPCAVVGARLRRAAEIAFFEAAKALGIKTYLIIHGHISKHPEYHFIDGFLDGVTKIFVWGEYQKEVIRAKEDRQNQADVEVVGNPCWDRVASIIRDKHFIHDSKRELIEKLQPEKPQLPFISFGSDEDLRKTAYRLIDSFSSKDVNFVVKVHPNEDVKFYLEQVKKRGAKNLFILKKEIDLYRLMKASDIFMTYMSTTNLEALLLDVPLLIVNLEDRPLPPNRIDLARYGFEEIRDLQKLASFIQRIIHDNLFRKQWIEQGQKAIHYYAYNRDGLAAQRVVESLLKDL